MLQLLPLGFSCTIVPLFPMLLSHVFWPFSRPLPLFSPILDLQISTRTRLDFAHLRILWYHIIIDWSLGYLRLESITRPAG